MRSYIEQSRTLSSRFWRHVQKPSPSACWTWTASRRTSGYGQISVKGRMTSTHRVSWELANGPIPDGLCVCHHCDNPLCVNPSHLFLGTNRDNIADRDRKGRGNQPRGSKNGRAKLTEQDVIAIRTLRAEGVLIRSLASKFGVCKSMVGSIVNRETWKHL